MTNTQVALVVAMCARHIVSSIFAMSRITWEDGNIRSNLSKIVESTEALDYMIETLSRRIENDRREGQEDIPVGSDV